MSAANFADNLYGCKELNHLGGCGLQTFCGSWHYERHNDMCRPGMWRVGVVGHAAREFWPLVSSHANAVVDDYGDLHAVGLNFHGSAK